MAEDAAGKLNLYNLGTQGVDLTKSVIHADEGTLRQAQNAVPDPRGEFGGIAKRDGLTEINATSIGGSVGGVIDVPLPATARLFIGADGGGTSNGWVYTDDLFDADSHVITDGKPASPVGFDKMSGLWLLVDALNAITKPACSMGNKLFYAGDQYIQGTTSPVIRMFDGRIDREFATVPIHPTANQPARGVIAMLPYRDVIYVATWDFSQSSTQWFGSIYKMDPITGQLTKFGQTSPGGTIPTCMAVSLGKLFVGTKSGNTTPKVYTVPVHGSDTFTQDLSTSGDVLDLKEYKGLLYAAISGDGSGQNAKVLVRALDGTWTTSKESTTPTSAYTSLEVFQGKLYATLMERADLSEAWSIEEFDGSTWTESLASQNEQTWPMLFTFNTRLFAFAIGNGINAGESFYTDDGDTWTEIPSELLSGGLPIIGVIGI